MMETTVEGRYELQGLVGRGGMGSVYRAVQRATDRPVAIKVLDGDDKDMLARFQREVRLTARLEHVNAVRVYDSGVTEEGRAYLVMELLRGHDLAVEIHRNGKVSLGRAVSIGVQVLGALHAAHAQGIIHRDIKPANVFLHRPEPGLEVVKVMDFGIAALVRPDEDATKLTQTGLALGTPSYMSPEQLMAQPLDLRTDLYSVGVVLFEMLVGRTPFQADTPMAMALKHVNEPLPPVGEARPDLALRGDVQAALERFTAKKPADRPPSARHAVALLESLDPHAVDGASLPGTGARDGAEQDAPRRDVLVDSMAETAPLVATPPPVPAATHAPSSPTPALKATVQARPPTPHPAGAPRGRSRARVAWTLAGAVAVVVLALAGETERLSGWLSGVPGDPGNQTTGDSTVHAGEGAVVPGLPSSVPAPAVQPAGASSASDGGVLEVTLEVVSTPPGAQVFLGRTVLGVTPLRHQVAPGGAPTLLRLELPGHQPAEVSVTPTRSQTVDVSLRAKVQDPASSRPPKRRAVPRDNARDDELKLEEL
jgi:hypothetical protein